MFVCLLFLVRFYFFIYFIFFYFLFFLQGGQQCWPWAFLAACPCTLFIDIISLCLLIGQIKMLACLFACQNKNRNAVPVGSGSKRTLILST